MIYEESTETQISKIPTFQELIQARNQAVENFNAIFQKQEELSKLSSLVDGHFTPHFIDEHKLKDNIKQIDYYFWSYVLKVLGITDSLTEKAKNDYLKKIQETGVIFNQEHILALKQNADFIYAEGFETTIKEVFKQLQNCCYTGPGYLTKRDNCQKIEKVFRIYGSVRWDSYFNKFKTERHVQWYFNFEDLLSACYLLEGRGKPKYNETIYSLGTEQLKDGDNKIETDYFTIVAYKNGNNKVHWKEDKLNILEKINKYGTGEESAIPGEFRKRYKKSHFSQNNTV